MIDINDALHIHQKSIREFGGGNGLREEGALLAALARPYQTFGQQDLYATPAEKAAALFESIIINHPFIDGNKRTAYALIRAMLFTYGYDILSFAEEKYQMTMEASKGEIRFDEIKAWIEERLVKINP
jgi:death-on-curing protein